MKEKESEVTFVSRYICHHAELACCNTVNLGACEFDDIPKAFVAGMSELCKLHGETNVGQSGEYLSSDVDRQVGLGVLGLANLLRRYGVTYEQFGRALEQFNNGEIIHTPAYALVEQFQIWN